MMRYWSIRVGFLLLRMIIFDAWLLHTGSRGALQTMVRNEVYEQLAMELVGNNYDAVRLRICASEVEGTVVLTPTSGIGPHATPTKKRKKPCDGSKTSVWAQRDCVMYGKRTTLVCSQCCEESSKEVFKCGSSK